MEDSQSRRRWRRHLENNKRLHHPSEPLLLLLLLRIRFLYILFIRCAFGESFHESTSPSTNSGTGTGTGSELPFVSHRVKKGSLVLLGRGKEQPWSGRMCVHAAHVACRTEGTGQGSARPSSILLFRLIKVQLLSRGKVWTDSLRPLPPAYIRPHRTRSPLLRDTYHLFTIAIEQQRNKIRFHRMDFMNVRTRLSLYF